MKTRIQHLAPKVFGVKKYRIQNEAALPSNVAPTACPGFKSGNMTKREQRPRVDREPHEICEPISSKQSKHGLEAGATGRSLVGKRVKLGKGGQEIGKWRSFSHFETALTRLFPLVSTQVVDFQHLAMVSIFCDGHEIGFSRLSREVAI